jgi:hypothetical protein
MEHDSMYDGSNDYKNKDGSPQAVGEAEYKLTDEGEWDDFSKVTGPDREVLEAFLVSCSEGDITPCEFTWKRWKEHMGRMGEGYESKDLENNGLFEGVDKVEKV